MSAGHLAFDWRREKNTFIWSNHPIEAFCSPAPSCLCWIWSIAFRQGSELSEISTHGHSFMYADDERLQWYHFTTDVCVWWWFCYRDDCESISLYWAKSVKQFSSSVLTISYYLNIFYLFSSYVNYNNGEVFTVSAAREKNGDCSPKICRSTSWHTESTRYHW